MTTVATRNLRQGSSQTAVLPEAAAYGREIDLIAERIGDVVTLRPVIGTASDGRRRVAALTAAMDAIGPFGEIEQRISCEFPIRGGA